VKDLILSPIPYFSIVTLTLNKDSTFLLNVATYLISIIIFLDQKLKVIIGGLYLSLLPPSWVRVKPLVVLNNFVEFLYELVYCYSV